MTVREFTAEPGARRFRESLLEEHLDEAAFLYEQRAARLGEEESWLSVEALEMRLEAHLDAIALFEPGAFERAAERASAGAAGDVFVALCTACRQRHWEGVVRLLDALDAADSPTAAAVQAALYVELPAEWQGHVRAVLEQPGAKWLPTLAEVCGRRRFNLASALIAALRRREGVAAVAGALGRLRATEAERELQSCLVEGSPTARLNALLALCRIGDLAPLAEALASVGKETWPRPVVGLAGGPRSVAALSAAIESGAGDEGAVLALGLLGDPASLPLLYRLLASEQTAGAAARAMYWMTGAPMMGEQFVADEVDEDALDEEELRRWRESGEPPRRADGEPFGTRKTTLITDAAAWSAWLKSHARSFQKGMPYRLGQPYTPEVASRVLRSPEADARLRAATVEEIATRFGCDIPLECELPVCVQRRLLTRVTSWAADCSTRFPPGAWYAAGVAVVDR